MLLIASYWLAWSLASGPEPEPFRFEAQAAGEPSSEGVSTPVDSWSTASSPTPSPPATPLGAAPRPTPPRVLDPRTTRIVRLDLLAGPVWRPRQVDAAMSFGAEIGPMRGFSGVFATAVLADPRRSSVKAIDVPIGGGVLFRGRLPKRPLYASIGLTAGLLVHRAKTERGLHHAIDPDLRLPIRFAWTIATVGVSLAIEQGYSFRDRDYSRRGAVVWSKGAYRIGFMIGLHLDVVAGRARVTLPKRRARSV